ncbi:efflux RND transporter periplasmic adaptor subunit [Herbaspirillum lusitanum]|uniref:efflux RND transporter periplasmic adaptor subunit n=1 Tax=Herbaspirillum lusitanum TaxID=213312 RepID=UPI0022384DC3|nr:efflux RND transporter periplasmic adaptor subunit [Herbaspirillum lusitanum]MCW5296926.1 efflux RND transporter periplasmic adaptor subunit [Herbaspirillum lusitanum]
MSSVSRFTRLTLTVVAAAALAACGQKPNAQAGAGMPPGEVSVVTIAPERVTISNELPGRLEATRVAEVRARVAGIILKRTFREGSEVKAGEVLYRIDPATFKANYDSALATLAKSQASLTQASLKAQRYKPLVEVNAVSKQEYDDAVAAQKQAEADVAAGKAAVQTAGLSLGYATVTSPISGRIGRALVTEGALVGQGDATQLAVVQQLDPIYVNLTQSSTDLLKLQQAMASGQLKTVGQGKAKVTLVTDDGRPYPLPGKLLFSDVTVDATTGAVTIRAEFPNPNRTLLPGMYVRAQLEQAVNESAIVVPQQAVMRDLNGSSVFVVGDDNKVAARPVKTGSAQGNSWIVTDGLKAGDRVIVEGIQKTKPGAPVKPVPWKGPAADAGAAPAGASAAPAGASAAPAAAPAKQDAATKAN